MTISSPPCPFEAMMEENEKGNFEPWNQPWKESVIFAKRSYEKDLYILKRCLLVEK